MRHQLYSFDGANQEYVAPRSDDRGDAGVISDLERAGRSPGAEMWGVIAPSGVEPRYAGATDGGRRSCALPCCIEKSSGREKSHTGILRGESERDEIAGARANRGEIGKMTHF